ncbi:MAG: tRNA (guanine(46)-N(7))-methyltransferase TrmB [Rhodospirillales bacterium]|jgi:tRNA (guanine-N7-)-methyltransferase
MRADSPSPVADPATGGTKFYGRRKGRPLHRRKADLVATLLPRIAISVPQGTEPVRPSDLFDAPPRAVWLEIGFGGGEHLGAQALARPDVGFVGCEPFLNGVASLLGTIETSGMDNVRIHPDDARPLLDRMVEASIARAFVLYPDPWPKKRHHGRRFIGPANLDRLARVLADGAELRMASDVPDLVDWMAAQVRAHPAFDGPEGDEGSWAVPPPDWVETRYERKALAAGRRPTYLTATRRPRAG